MNSKTTFISYSRVDTDFVINLAKDLRLAGANIWLDQIDIGVGERWDNSVQKALINCNSLLIIYSPDSVASENVLDEVYYVLGEKRKVIPVLYKKCEIPFRLKRLQYIDFTQDYSQGIQKLLTLMTSETEEPFDKSLINISSKRKTSANLEENKKHIKTKKNVAEDINLNIKGNVTIGDKDANDQKYDQKNVIKKGKIKSDGDFNLGDS